MYTKATHSKKSFLFRFTWLLGLFLALKACQPQEQQEAPAEEAVVKDTTAIQDTTLHLSNTSLELRIRPYGGAFTGVIPQGKEELNPLTWSAGPAENRAPFRGHFLCMGRWGAVTPGEKDMGIPRNGQPAAKLWDYTLTNQRSAEMQIEAQKDGIVLTRKIALHKTSPSFKVVERYKNIFPIGRLNNVVQHVTLAPPFLDTSLLINANAGHGFNQKVVPADADTLNPIAHAYQWPKGYDSEKGGQIDFRTSKEKTSYVTTHIFDADDKNYAWVTATHPQKGFVLGYIWEKVDYPWLHIWHQTDSLGNPVAKGLEFGTQGIGSQTLKELTATDTRFYGQPSFQWHDAGQEWLKAYYGFMLPIEQGVEAIESIHVQGKEAHLSYITDGTKKEKVLPLP